MMMDKKQDALVPVKDAPEHEAATQVEEEYQQAKTYFKESVSQAARTNAALVTCLAMFVVRGAQYIWEGITRFMPGRKDEE